MPAELACNADNPTELEGMSDKASTRSGDALGGEVLFMALISGLARHLVQKPDVL